MMAVDILPTALPLEASQHFSKAFLPYLRSLIADYNGHTHTSGSHENTKEALKRATVASGGRLSESFEWLRKPLGVWKDSLQSAAFSSKALSSEGDVLQEKRNDHVRPYPKKKVLMLGSGMVAPPAVAEICSRPDVELVVGECSLLYRLGMF